MNISDKIKAVNNKIEQNKAKYNLDIQIAKMSALSSGNVSKYQFLTDKELKKKTSVAEKKYKKFDNAFESNKKEEDETKNIRTRTKLNLVYNIYFSFYKYNNTKEFKKRSFDSKTK